MTKKYANIEIFLKESSSFMIDRLFIFFHKFYFSKFLELVNVELKLFFFTFLISKIYENLKI